VSSRSPASPPPVRSGNLTLPTRSLPLRCERANELRPSFSSFAAAPSPFSLRHGSERRSLPVVVPLGGLLGLGLGPHHRHGALSNEVPIPPWGTRSPLLPACIAYTGCPGTVAAIFVYASYSAVYVSLFFARVACPPASARGNDNENEKRREKNDEPELRHDRPPSTPGTIEGLIDSSRKDDSTRSGDLTRATQRSQGGFGISCTHTRPREEEGR